MIKKLVLGIIALIIMASANVTRAEVKIVKIDGSSTVYPVTEAVAEEFQKAKKGAVNVTVGISGTGGGFKKFCRGETDISDASRPILAKEIEVCKQNGVEYIELPVAYDGLAVMVNPKNTWAASMTVAELKILWEPAAQGKITKWSQIRPNWPDKKINLFGAGTDSGTFDYFTEAITGKSKSSRGDFTASEDDNVLVQGIGGDMYSLGFFGLAYYEENTDKLKLVAIDDGKGPVAPSEKTVKDGSYQPLSRPIFIYVSRKSAEKPEIKEFIEFYLRSASKLVKQVKYISLPDAIYKKDLERFSKKETGSVFGGDARVGATIDDLFKEKPKM
ncbi:MAG: PstS family phosphate ABC transporter substrate-binding protein [Nitrospiraceae bacterium]|nr:MAG: PstS family phosphate ABC transporter substrate-binding protein [Nitrospiraceae bacterium]